MCTPVIICVCTKFLSATKSVVLVLRLCCVRRDVYDTVPAMQAQFALDWSRIVAKSRFTRLVGREDKGVGVVN